MASPIQFPRNIHRKFLSDCNPVPSINRKYYKFDYIKDNFKMDDQADVAEKFRTESDETRELTEEDKEKLRKQDMVSDFKKQKLEQEAMKNWDKFYKRNKDNFFKDRNWSHQDLQLLCRDVDFLKPLVYLEAGCGVGNMLFPLANAFPLWRFQGFDFSANAVQLLVDKAKELEVPVETSVVDLSVPSTDPIFSETADLVSLIFVLSAIHPEKHTIVAENLKKFVKVGGSVIIRDYGANDHAMVRFGRGAKLDERFYARQDGTRAYYFYTDELRRVFEDNGWSCVHIKYLHRRSINQQKALNVPRIFVEARFIRQEA